jgi:uncharacterized protein (TIGR03118 family)
MARLSDPHLVNPWGISFTPAGFFWLADNGSGASTLYDGEGGSLSPGAVLGVTIPTPSGPAGSPTGTVFHDGPGFMVSANGKSGPSQFLFATEEGTIAGWNFDVDPSQAVVAVDSSPNSNLTGAGVYKGLALAETQRGTFLYAANFRAGNIDVFDQSFAAVRLPGAFADPNLPAGYAPFNIQTIAGNLFVAYAKQDGARHDEVDGPGNGFIDVFDPAGNLLRHFAGGGQLDAPWGMALAPDGFGAFSNDLLVGNFGDGHINAFDPQSGAFRGPLTDANGTPIVIDSLWALTFGNGGGAGDPQSLYFTAGVAYEQHGLFGKLEAPGQSHDNESEKYLPDPRDRYPLPPEIGPVIQEDVGAQPAPVTVLLPLDDASLAMVPTLLTVSDRARGLDLNTSTLPALAAVFAGMSDPSVVAPNRPFTAVGVAKPFDGILSPQRPAVLANPSPRVQLAAGSGPTAGFELSATEGSILLSEPIPVAQGDAFASEVTEENAMAASEANQIKPQWGASASLVTDGEVRIRAAGSGAAAGYIVTPDWGKLLTLLILASGINMAWSYVDIPPGEDRKRFPALTPGDLPHDY